MKYLLIITLTLLLDRAHPQSHVQSPAIPEVFLIGEYEAHYLELSKQHPAVFMSLYANDIDKAYAGWSELLMDIEDYSIEKGLDLKGVKLWLNIYFNADGTISNLAFFPKPNSKNIAEEELITFFTSFVHQYKFTVTSTKGYQHSASASFPTFFKASPVTAKSN